MTLILEIPSTIEQSLLARWTDLPRKVLEALAVEAYRQEALSHRQVGDLLGLDYWQTEEFLKEHEASLHYDPNDLASDRQAISRALRLRPQP